MKLDIEKKLDARIAVAFEEVLPGPDIKSRQEVLKGVRALIRAVWMNKIHAALPKVKTTIPEYFLDAELEQFLNEAVDESYTMVSLIAERAKRELRG